MTRHQDVTIALLIALVSFLVYANSLGNEFVWDDDTFIAGNPHITDWRNIPSFFTSSQTQSDNIKHNSKIFRPLRTLSYGVDYSLWGLNAPGFHLTNILLHVVCSVLVFLIARSIFEVSLVAASAGLVFALHPIHTEAVTFLAGRPDALAGVFFLLSFLLYIRGKGFGRRRYRAFYALSVVTYFLSLLAKEMAITLPLILVLYDSSFRDKGERWLWRIALYCPYVVAGLAYLVYRTWALGRFGHLGFWVFGFYPSMLTVAKAFALYVKLLFFPVNLSAYYSVFPVSTSILEVSVLGSLAVLALCLGGGLSAYRFSKGIFFSVLWFFLTLIPVSHLVPMTIFASERFLYIPSVGFCLLAGLFVSYVHGQAVARPNSALRSKVLFLSASLALVFLSMGTVRRNTDWKDEITLWSRSVAKDPGNLGAHRNLGRGYIKKGHYGKAIATFQNLIMTTGGAATEHIYLGIAYESEKLYDLAAREYRTALKIDPNNSEMHYYLARVYLRMGLSDEAHAEYAEYQRAGGGALQHFDSGP